MTLKDLEEAIKSEEQDIQTISKLIERITDTSTEYLSISTLSLRRSSNKRLLIEMETSFRKSLAWHEENLLNLRLKKIHLETYLNSSMFMKIDFKE